MSYTAKVINETIDVEYNHDYPASEHGGTVSGTIKVPVEIHVDVDDGPFNRSVHNCVTTVQQLKASVVATQAAEVMSRETNAMRLGETLTEGFFGLVSANVDMQAKEELARLESVAVALEQQKQDLMKKQDIMEGDYQRIKERYVDIFLELDKELRQRVFALQEATFRLAENCGKEQERNMRSVLPNMAVVGQKESLELQAKICSSNLKQCALRLIERTKLYILGNNVLKSKIQAMLVPGQAHETRYVPVLFMESADNDGGKLIRVFDNEMLSVLRVSGDSVRRDITSRYFDWKDMDTRDQQQLEDQLQQQVDRNLGNTPHDVRVAAWVKRLWEKQRPAVVSSK